MAKTTSIDLSDVRLITLAAELVDNHEYLRALKMLNKNAETWGNYEDSLELYAEIYDDLNLYWKSVYGWFRFLDISSHLDNSDCYEGLAVGFMNLGDEHAAAYYYNKLLLETDGLDAATRESIVNEFLAADAGNHLKFAYPPEIADCSGIISEGITLMKAGEYEKAIEEFEKICEGNPVYLSARNHIAMCKVIADRAEEAENECRAVLENNPENVQAMTTLAAVMTEQGKREESRALADKLLALNVTEAEDIYKIATVCCENEMHLEAYETFMRLPHEFDYDLNVLYFKAVAAFNAGLDVESREAFDVLTTVYPDAVTARYYSNLARSMVRAGKRHKLTYFYRLPSEVRESSLKLLAAFSQLSAAEVRKLNGQVDLTATFKWCFDEHDFNNSELQALAVSVAIKAKMLEEVRDVLLNPSVDDKIKVDALCLLAEMNEPDCYGVVICNIYRRVTTQKLNIGRLKKKRFLAAYAKLFAHFSILDDGYSESFALAAEKIYAKLENDGNLKYADDADALGAAIYRLSGVRAAEINGEEINSFFGVNDKRVNKILGGLI